MNEKEFNALSSAVLTQIEQGLESCSANLDFSMAGDGVLEIEFSDGSKVIVNRHAAAQEIWVAARAGGFHFRWDGAVWRDTRDGSELFQALTKLVSQQSGEIVSFNR